MKGHARVPFLAAMPKHEYTLTFMLQPDGREHAIVHPQDAAHAAAAAATGWGDSDCACAALTALAGASAAELATRSLTLTGGALHALLDGALREHGLCFMRRVAARDTAAPCPPLPAPAAALGGFTGEPPPPCALLLTHAFELGPDAERLTLTTLMATHDSDTDADMLRRAVFGDATVALLAQGTCTLLSLGGGAYVGAEALAALPAGTRAAVRAAQRVQVYDATATAIGAHACSVFDALMPAASRLLPASLATPLGELGTHMAAAAAAVDSAGVTRELLAARTREAEALEASARFDDAAALYRRNLADDTRAPGARLLLSPPMEWAYLGLALKRAGRFADARTAYAAGVRAAAVGPMSPDTPTCRESHRLHLRSLEVTLHLSTRDMAARCWSCFGTKSRRRRATRTRRRCGTSTC